MAKLIAVYRTPKDAAAFNAYYFFQARPDREVPSGPAQL